MRTPRQVREHTFSLCPAWGRRPTQSLSDMIDAKGGAVGCRQRPAVIESFIEVLGNGIGRLRSRGSFRH